MKILTLFMLGLLLSCTMPNSSSSTPAPSSVAEYQSKAELEQRYVAEVAADSDFKEVARSVNAVLIKEITIADRYFLVLQSREFKKDGLALETKKSISLSSLAELDSNSLPAAVYSLEKDYAVQISPPTIQSSNALYMNQYALQNTDLPNAWPISKGGGVRIAVIDSGINTQHEDFSGTSFEGGWDFVNYQPYPNSANYDTNGHGTHVAGIIAANINNKGISGVAPNAILIPYRVFNASGRNQQSIIAEAVNKAVIDKVDIINMSLGSNSYSSILAVAIEHAIEKGITVVAAAGNDAIAMVNYPAAFPGVIAVGSSNSRDLLSYFSSRGIFVDITAPGENILSLSNVNNSGYLLKSGTSMATPFISGTMALLRQHYPDASSDQLERLMETTAIDAGATGYDSSYGWGLVRPALALQTTPPAAIESGRLTFRLNEHGRSGSNRAAINIYNDEQQRLHTVYTDSGSCTISLPYGNYLYSTSYYGYNSGLQELTVNQNEQRQEYTFPVELYTIATLRAADTPMLDTIIKVYSYGYDPYNLIAFNDDNGSNLYASVTVALKPNHSLLFRVNGYNNDTGDYALYISRGAKNLGSDIIDVSELAQPSTSSKEQPILLKLNTPYHGMLNGKAGQQYYQFP